MRTFALLLLACASQLAPAQTLPSLYFDAPPGFAGSGTEVATFTAPDGDLVVHIYPFRRLGPGEFQARFRETLLREFVAQNLREGRHDAPRIEPASVEGAEAAAVAKFTDAGRERSRLAMLFASTVAIIDVTASNSAATEKHAAALKALFDSMSVGQPKARAAPPPMIATPEIAASVSAPVAPKPAAEAAPPAPIAPEPLFSPGAYVANVRRLIPSYVGGVQSGGMWVTGPQYLIFSGDGRVHRNYEQPRVPGGDVGRFDWSRAQLNDAGNTGTYEVIGSELTLRIATETISAKLVGPGRFEIFGSQFKRTTLK